ncbi:5'-methylthioadenosine phosphorylase, partial [Streptomyces nigra]
DAVAALPANEDRDCLCAGALGGMDPGFVLP